MNRPILFISGGLDSYLASCLLPDAILVFVDYGQPYLELEMKSVKLLYDDVQYISLSGIPPVDISDYYVPARNLMFATLGLRYGNQICIVGMQDEMCSDKNPSAFADMNVILNKQAKSSVRVFSPFWNLTKAEAVRDYLNSGGSPETLLLTVSCYDGIEEPCGNCQACFRRWVALRSNDLEVKRPTDHIIRSYGLKNWQNFPFSRIQSILQVIEDEHHPIHYYDLEQVISDPDIIEKTTAGYTILCTGAKYFHPTEEILKLNGVSYDGILWGFNHTPSL